MQNPLLQTNTLPAFDLIQPEHVEPAIDEILGQNRANLEQILATNADNWAELITPIEQMEERLSRVFSPVSHLHSVKNSEPLRAAYNACLPKLSAYHSELGQNRRLHDAFRRLSDNPAFAELSTAQQKLISDALRDFHLSGVDLPTDKQDRYRDIARELSDLTSKFEQHLLDATQAWKKLISDVEQLAGVPESSLAMLRQNAEAKDMDGWLLTLDFPSYHAIITYADDRNLRQEIYTAFCTRASDQGPQANEYDNSALMEQILALRHEQAQLLGFANYAELSIETKMAESVNDVEAFLRELGEKSRGLAEQELASLRDFAKLEDFQSWDAAYYSEKLRQQSFAISQEELRPYFPAPSVFDGLFAVAEKLFGVQILEAGAIATWHDDVRFFEIRDNDQPIGQFYLDLYAREHKRGGAWMDVCRSRIAHDGIEDAPVAYLTCNATPPVGDKPALLTHDDVVTLFHEFGHGLHHMLTRVAWPSVGGINGVEWDAVELPSQFLENWCWEREALNLFARHWESGEPMPNELFDRMLAAKNFQCGMQMLRQIEFSLFDLLIHRDFDPQTGGRIQETLNQLRDQIAVLMPPAFNRFQHGFSHIFAGGYAAGYYSYKWAEVLSADAFSAFEEAGVFDQATGQRFRECVLERGASVPASELFSSFRGRAPTIDALLRHNGIENEASA